MKEEKGNNVFAYISIVAIVAIAAVFVMFAGSGSKEATHQTLAPSGGDVIGDARHMITSGELSSSIQDSISDGFLLRDSTNNVLSVDERRVSVTPVDEKTIMLEDKQTGETRFKACGCPSSCEYSTCYYAIWGLACWGNCFGSHCGRCNWDTVSHSFDHYRR